MKSFSGFSSSDKKPIASGKWGAGAFGGDAQLKFLIQWMSASEANKTLKYFTAGSFSHAEDVHKIISHIQNSGNVTVGNLCNAIDLYNRKIIQNRREESLFDFLRKDKNCQKLVGIAR